MRFVVLSLLTISPAFSCSVFAGGTSPLFRQPAVISNNTVPLESDYSDNINMDLTKIASLPPESTTSPALLVPRQNRIIPTAAAPSSLGHDISPTQRTILSPQLAPKTTAPLHPIRRDMAILNWEENTKKWFSPVLNFFKPIPFPTFPPVKNFFDYERSRLLSKAPRLSSPLSHHLDLSMDVSPAISWTFCEPVCGSGDQAVDEESAADNAEQDIRESERITDMTAHQATYKLFERPDIMKWAALFQIAIAFQQLNLLPPREEEVIVSYKPNSTLLKEFGNYYDKDGSRYLLYGSAVFSKQHQNASHIEPFITQIRSSINYSHGVTKYAIGQIVRRFTSYLTSAKGVRFHREISYTVR